MKKRALYLFAMVMAVLFFAAPALAENVNHETAALFIEHLDEEGYHYTYQGIDDNDYDRMQMSFEGDNCDPLVNLFFDASEERCSLRVWDVIEYEEVMEPVILGIVNDLNEQYMYAKWTADDDFTVTASMDVLLAPERGHGRDPAPGRAQPGEHRGRLLSGTGALREVNGKPANKKSRGCERTTKVLSQPLLAIDTVPVCPIRPAHAICYGNRTEIFVPLPGSLTSEICAPCSCAMCFTMDRPSPVPPASRERLFTTR